MTTPDEEAFAEYEAQQLGGRAAWSETLVDVGAVLDSLVAGPAAQLDTDAFSVVASPTPMVHSRPVEAVPTNILSVVGRSWTGSRPLSMPKAERTHGPDLDEALKDLKEAPDEAREEGYPPPDELATKNARRLLHHMYELRPCRYEVYSTRDREMCIYIPEGGRSVLVTCDPDGGVHCSTSLERGHSRTYYDRDYAADPPPSFLQEALATLDVT